MRIKLLLWLLWVPLFTIGQKPEIQLNLGHTSEITSLTFSADGKYLISSSANDPFKCWSVSSGKLLATAPQGASSAYRSYYLLEDNNTVVFAEGLREVIFGGMGAPRFWVWNIQTGGVQSIDAGSQAVAAPIDFGRGNLGTVGKTLKKFLENRQGSNINFSGFTPDGKFYFEQVDNQLKYFRLFEARPQFSVVYQSLGSSYAFSNDGKYIFNTRSDFDGRQEKSFIWEVASGKRLTTAMVPDSLFLSDITNDGQWALTTSRTGQFGLFNLKTGKTTRNYNKNGAFNSNNIPVHAAAISPDGQLIARGQSDGAIVIQELKSGKVQTILKGYSHQMNAVDISKNTPSIKISDDEHRWWDWDLNTGLVSVKEKTTPEESKNPDLNLIGIAEDQTMGIITKEGKGLILYDLQQKSEIKVLSKNPYYDRAVFSPDNQKAFLVSSPQPGEGKPVYEDNLFIDLENGATLFALRHTQSYRGIAISPDGGSLLLGGYNGNIYQYDLSSGALLHHYLAFNSPIVDIKFSSNGEKFIAISKDAEGKAFIWDLATRSKIATLYILGKKDWVVMNEEGLFDASPNAMNILFYKVKFKEEVEIVDLEQLKARYYEPGLLPKLMGVSDERIRPIEGFEQIELYPQIKALIKENILIINLTERNGGIGKVSVFINGKEVEDEANPLPRGNNAKRSSTIHFDLTKHYNYLLKHPDSINIIGIRAYNETGWLKSPFVELQYKLNFQTKSGGNNNADRNSWVGKLDPKLYIISIGTSDYTGTQLDLQYADQDATMMAQAFKSVGGALFKNDETGEVDSLEIYCFSTTLKDSTETENTSIQWQFSNKANIKATFDGIKTNAKAEDIIVVYLSGHGITRGGQDQTLFYYLTQGVASEESLSDPVTLNTYTISSEELTKWINDIPALKQVIIIDACNSGQVVENLTGGTKTLNSNQIRALDRMKDRTGMFVLSGSASDKVSYEASEFGQGLLTYALLEGMRGVATKKAGSEEFVDVMTLFQYARDRVPELAASINGIQTPMLGFPSRAASFDIGISDTLARQAIPIGNKKPVIIRSVFINSTTLKDNLNLSGKLENAFREESENGADAAFIYVDVNDYPGAHSLGGIYTPKEEGISIEINLFKKDGNPESLNIKPQDDVDRLVKMIVRQVKRALLEDE